MKKQTSPARLRPLAWTVFLFALLLFLFFDWTKHLPALAEILPFGDDPYDAVGSFSIQLTFVTACLSLVRAYRPAPAHANDEPVDLILRGIFTALFSALVMLASDVIAMLRFASMWTNAPAQTLLLTSVVGMVGITGALLTWAGRMASFQKPKVGGLILFLAGMLILALYPAAWRGSIIGGIATAMLGMLILFAATFALTRVFIPAHETPSQDFLDDLNAIYQSLKQRIKFLDVLEHKLKMRRLRFVLDWFNPRRHIGRLLLVIALLMGACLLTAEMLAEGLASNAAIVVLVAAVYLGIEGAAVLLGYLLFGKYLGIFRSE